MSGGRTTGPPDTDTLCSRAVVPAPLPLLDVGVIDQLAEELGDRSAVARFLRSFVELLPGRVAAIGAFGEPGALVDQTESIAAAASMAGAHRLAQCVAEIVDAARAGRLPEATEVRALHREASATRAELGYYLEALEAAS
ncbi:MAG TPA: hypothetical protein VNF07_07395 [Acidimicrobiales bacterium]|nr:hypothetical protein [Acidimicrobiales bacterium]